MQELLIQKGKKLTNFDKATKDVIVCKILEHWDNIKMGRHWDNIKMGRASSSKDDDEVREANKIKNIFVKSKKHQTQTKIRGSLGCAEEV